MVHLQKLHETNAGKGLVVLGFDSADKAALATEHLRKHGVTYSTVLDNSQDALKVTHDYRIHAVPTTYVIDRKGNVAAAWTGGLDDNATLKDLLTKLGLESSGEPR